MDDQNYELGLTTNIGKELFETTLDLNVDYANLALEHLIENPAVKNIPYVKTLIALWKVPMMFNERHKIKKLLVFFKEFHSKTLDAEKIAAFKEKFNIDEKYRNLVIEKIMVLNEKFIELEQSKVFANLTRAHIEGNLDLQEFNHLSFVVTNLHPTGYVHFKEMALKEWGFNRRDPEIEAVLLSAGIAHRWGTFLGITLPGRKLYEFGIKPVLE